MERPRACNTWTWQQQQQSIWNWASTSTVPPTKAPVTESVNSLRPSFVPPILSEPPPCFPMLTPTRPFPPNVSLVLVCYSPTAASENFIPPPLRFVFAPPFI